uniref:Uncharacterized protein n=1 Tax=Avena sativa TaxID=4498 RepID=A0ACD5X5T7_AVESA
MIGAEASPANQHVPLLGAPPPPPDEGRPRRRPWRAICWDVLFFAIWTLFGLLCIWSIACFIYTAETTGAVEYSVAITGVDGLDPAIDLRSDLRPTLSPVFNLTIYIKEFDKFIAGACMGGHSTELIVSYRDAFLGKGAVPGFCVPTMREKGVATKAWGVDVVVPRFLRDQLAGELKQGQAAVLDVVVTDPSYWGAVLACEAKIGGDRCPCKFHS